MKKLLIVMTILCSMNAIQGTQKKPEGVTGKSTICLSHQHVCNPDSECCAGLFCGIGGPELITGDPAPEHNTCLFPMELAAQISGT